MSYPILRGAAVALSLGLAAGCGLISSDVTNFDLALTPKTFTIDASRWVVDTTKAPSLFSSDGKLMALPCNSMPTVCSSAVAQACTSGCTGSCDMTANACQMSLDVSVTQPVDLMMEQPELKTISNEPVIKVSIDSVTYEVTSNTLNVPTPAISIYVAPTSVVKAPDAQAKLVGTIPPVQPDALTSGPQMLMFSDTGKADLVNIMSQFKTPFNVLVGSSLLVQSGQALPMGKLEAVVHISGHAGL